MELPVGNKLIDISIEQRDAVDLLADARSYIGDRPLSSTNVRTESFDLTMPVRRFGKELRLEGFRKRELVAATRVPLP